MMKPDLLHFLWHSTLMLSLALIAVLALRGPWLRCFGARNVMLLWLSVPATMLSLFLPAPVRLVEGGASLTLAPADRASLSPVSPLPGTELQPGSSIEMDGLLLALWIAGAVLMTTLLTVRQWRYHRSLGRLNPLQDGSFRSQFTHAGPALVGALRPRIVVPADFERRYNPEQRALIIAHERCHLRRGDAQFTLLASLVRCLFWFNPLVHLAWSRFRIDQEMACDASVLRAHPGTRRDYAEAMLSTQFATSQLPVGCTWLTGDPLRRRITMLYTQPPGKIKLLVGTVLALSASTAAAVGAWSSQEPQLRYLSAGTPQMQLATAIDVPEAPVLALPEPATAPPAPDAEMSPPAPPPATAPPSPAAPPAPAPEPAPSPADTGNSAQEREPAPAPEVRPRSNSDKAPKVDVQPARLVETSRPSFPRTFSKPELVSYSGMPEAERPGPDWRPDGRIWRMELRVALDEAGEPVKASIADNDFSSNGMVRRYERLALRAVKDWRYEPARVGGMAVASEVMLAFHFDTHFSRPHDIGDGPLPAPRQNFNKRPRTWK